ncbi:MAG: type II toxin-antitoxin system HicB family antitoxin [Bacteroidales bacterium]|nr:type II toxin-antitoxin system HicB family antitoxin [Bacteroidales bacterium]
MGDLHYKGYTGSVEYDEEGNYFHGRVLGLYRDGIVYEGTTAEELKKDFQEGIDDYLQGCAAHHMDPEKPYSGRTIVRMSSQLHQEAAAKARSIGISLNEFINRAISAAVL